MTDLFELNENSSNESKETYGNLLLNLSSDKKILINIHNCFVVLLMAVIVFDNGCHLRVFDIYERSKHLKSMVFYLFVKVYLSVFHILGLVLYAPKFTYFDAQTMLLIFLCPVGVYGRLFSQWSRGDEELRNLILVFEQLTSCLGITLIYVFKSAFLDDHKTMLTNIWYDFGFIICVLVSGLVFGEVYPTYAASLTRWLTYFALLGLFTWCIPMEVTIFPSIFYDLGNSLPLLAVEVSYIIFIFVVIWLVGLVLKDDAIELEMAAVTSAFKDLTPLLFVTISFPIQYVYAVWSLVFKYAIVINVLVFAHNLGWFSVKRLIERSMGWLNNETAPNDVFVYSARFGSVIGSRLGSLWNRGVPRRWARDISGSQVFFDRIQSQATILNLEPLMRSTGVVSSPPLCAGLQLSGSYRDRSRSPPPTYQEIEMQFQPPR